MKRYSEIPKHIWNIVNHKKNGFDLYFCHLLGKGMSKDEAFNTIIDELQEHFPDFSTYKTLYSYYPNYIKRNNFSKESAIISNKMIIVPNSIVEVATEWKHFDIAWIKLVGQGKSRQEAFDELCEQIRYHFPMWVGVKNFETYRKLYEKRLHAMIGNKNKE